MGETIVRSKIRRWGNGYGIALSAKAVERLDAKEGVEVTARIKTGPQNVDFSDAGIFRFGPNASRQHEEAAGAYGAKERRRWHRA